jgi:Calcineurin-like phosphoesterase
MRKAWCSAFVILASAAAACAQGGAAAPQSTGAWRFAVSGDSRNCGDVVMPGIAAGVARDNASFYWHLGDFRAIYDFDEDIVHQPEHLAKPLTIQEYEGVAWQDFIDSQLKPFGSTPVFLTLGNHETIPPKARADVLPQFADWLNAPVIARQRLLDDPRDHLLKGYYHWIERGVAFYTLDNSTADQYDAAQMSWFERVLARDVANPAITAIVAGMHEALPASISSAHSMDQFAAGTDSGRRVYADLLRAQNASRKHVYVLASHSHYFMDGIFNTQYWRTHGGVLPGWIVGTAGAVRYALPPDWRDAHAAQTNVYGYLLATVQPTGEMRFDFKRLGENDVPSAVVARYKPDFVHWCFAHNSEAPQEPAGSPAR